MKLPTCTEKGYTTHTCSRCVDTYIDSITEAFGHKFGTEADCLNDQNCTICGAILTERLGHDYNAVVTNPTCTEKGYTTHTCTRCDDTYTDSETDAIAHTPSDWIVDIEPAPGVEGSQHKECTVCGETLETEVLEAMENDANTEPKLPTDSESNQNSSDSSDGCTGTLSVTAFGVILLAAIASMFLVKRREENC